MKLGMYRYVVAVKRYCESSTSSCVADDEVDGVLNSEKVMKCL